MLVVVLAFLLAFAIWLYTSSVEPVAHAIVDNAEPGNGCALLTAWSLVIPALLLLAAIVSLAG